MLKRKNTWEGRERKEEMYIDDYMGVQGKDEKESKEGTARGSNKRQ